MHICEYFCRFLEMGLLKACTHLKFQNNPNCDENTHIPLPLLGRYYHQPFTLVANLIGEKKPVSPFVFLCAFQYLITNKIEHLLLVIVLILFKDPHQIYLLCEVFCNSSLSLSLTPGSDSSLPSLLLQYFCCKWLESLRIMIIYLLYIRPWAPLQLWPGSSHYFFNFYIMAYWKFGN